MDTFGQKLRQAIESRGLSLEYVARATGMDIAHLRALERDDHGALPEDESVTDGLQAIARLVDVEPAEVVNDYLREREQYWQAAVTDVNDAGAHDAPRAPEIESRMPEIEALAPESESAVPESESAVPEIESAVPDIETRVPESESRRPASRPLLTPGVLALGAALLLVFAGIVWLWPSGTDETAPSSTVSSNELPAAPASATAGGEMQASSETPTGSQGGQAAPARRTQPSPGRGDTAAGSPPVAMSQSREAAAVESGTPAQNAATTTAPPEPVAQAPTAVGTAAASGLAIPQHGVGTGVVNHQLVGEADRFAEGTRVWYWTWVEGATSGEAIRHVWLHEGREMLSVPLKIGGARWRTQSYKNLHRGSTGQWTVEARDESGRVLARRVFQCFGPAAD